MPAIKSAITRTGAAQFVWTYFCLQNTKLYKFEFMFEKLTKVCVGPLYAY